MSISQAVISLKIFYQAALDTYAVIDASTGQPVLAMKPYLRLWVYHGGALSQDHDTGLVITPTFIAQRFLHKKEKRSGSLSPHGHAVHPPLPVQFIEHARQSRCVYFSLLMAECRRLRWLDIADDLQSLATLFHDEPWHLETFALAYFYELLANGSGGFDLHAASSHPPEQKQHRLLMLNTYLTQTPNPGIMAKPLCFNQFDWY